MNSEIIIGANTPMAGFYNFESLNHEVQNINMAAIMVPIGSGLQNSLPNNVNKEI